MFSYNKLLGRMAECEYSQKLLANTLGISENALSRKLKGHANFNSLEIATICNVLKIPKEEIGLFFFTLKV